MKRKVIKQGNDTLTITLPKKWVKKTGLKGGDEINVEELYDSLVIGNKKEETNQEIDIDVSNLDRSTINLLIQSRYRYGYDTINILTSTPFASHYRINKKVSTSSVVYNIVNRFVGAEVVSASEKNFVIKKITDESIGEFENLLRRIFRLVNEMIDSFIQGAKENNMDILESIEFQHINLKKFINFCLRLLNKYGYEDSRKTCFYFNLISLLSKLEDIIKNHGRYVVKYSLKLKSPQFFELLNNIKKSINDYYDLFYNYNTAKITTLNKNRDFFREHLFKYSKELSKDENIIIGGMSQIIELIIDMTETRIALED
ncbi:MAG: AbrB/MazE/SpoVT family DNA-binding domain-containing protein [Nanoarchaeota archaeon]|nr:AbrB/MazE/SpoVT family DNA-binding domain-containing protein [Nanoarchaeota archaeon]